jgi:hypothetical protein
VPFLDKTFGEILEKYVFASVKLTIFAISGEKNQHFLYHKIEKKNSRVKSDPCFGSHSTQSSSLSSWNFRL